MNQPARTPESDTRLPYPEDTVFFVPDAPYEAQVIRGYLNKKYKNIPKDMIVSQVNMGVLPHLEKLKFIVCVRRGADGNPPGDAYNVVPDERGILREKPIAPETYHREVYESPSIRARDHMQAARISLFTQNETNLLPLIDALAEHAYPCRIFPQNKPDLMLKFMVA
jgi:hypothetical protein